MEPVTTTRKGLGINVLEAARQRITAVFDGGIPVCVTFSGGKDSGVLLHLVAEEARRRGRRFTVLFLDWEAQFQLTIDYIRQCLTEYADCVDPLWVCLPLVTVNGCSQIEPEWTCWAPEKRALWVREPPPDAITDPAFFPFYTQRMTFEDFVGSVEAWFGGVILTGIRASESMDRYYGVFSRLKQEKFGDRPSLIRTVNPLYDWSVRDIWVYYARTGKAYNPMYDRMHQAGLSLRQMRICEPYGNEQRKGLHLFHVLEPQSWPKVCARVAGANTGALYAKESGNVMGNIKISLPAGHTWQTYAGFLLRTMPKSTAEHYRNKIAVYTRWYAKQGLPFPDAQDKDTGAKDDRGSWRRICKVLLKNDYWCIGLGFQPTKGSAYDAYVARMALKRAEWERTQEST
jgi:predicted phosphoadenosine phosphosulfate sulfurtransferase